jgi:predicted RNA-binding protein with PUA-like domain
MSEKVCSKCLASKKISEFYRRKCNTDGYSGVCKLCNRSYVNRAVAHAYEIKYYLVPANVERRRLMQSEIRKNNRNKKILSIEAVK